DEVARAPRLPSRNLTPPHVSSPVSAHLIQGTLHDRQFGRKPANGCAVREFFAGAPYTSTSRRVDRSGAFRDPHLRMAFARAAASARTPARLRRMQFQRSGLGRTSLV